MNLTPETMTADEMTERLYGAAEEIFLLCAIINRRGLAHAFCELSGHTQTLSVRVRPVDSEYMGADRTTAALREAEFVELSFSEPDLYRAPADYRHRIGHLTAFAQWLDELLEAGEPVTTQAQRA